MRLLLPALLCAIVVAAACNERQSERRARDLTGGDPAAGRRVITKYGCDGCHRIPGVLTADGTVGPPLDQIARRTYLAGRIANTPQNMVRFIRTPQSVDELTAMPATGVTEQDGRDIAAYLYTLR
jgi:cytochrome c2